MLGGSSSINGLLYIRGLASDYDAWAAAGKPGWAFDDVLPYFRRAEDSDFDNAHPPPETHATTTALTSRA